MIFREKCKILIAIIFAFSVVTLPIFEVTNKAEANTLVSYSSMGLIGNNLNNTKVYKGASIQSGEIGTLVTNSTVYIVAKTTGWYQILYANTTGFVEMKYVNETPKPVAINSKGKVTGIDTLPVRKAPHYLAAALQTLVKDEIIEITGVTELWYEVKLVNGKGYVNRQYVSLVNAQPDTIVKEDANNDQYEDDSEETEDEGQYEDDSEETEDEGQYEDDSEETEDEGQYEDDSEETEDEGQYEDDSEETEDEGQYEDESSVDNYEFLSYTGDKELTGTKIWTVTFNKNVDPTSINKNTVKVYDASSKEISVIYSIQNNVVKVKPVKKYKEGDYTLVLQDVVSDKGTELSKTIHFDFTISK